MKITVYDNGGKTIDRYTVIVSASTYSAVFGMSEYPLSSYGFNQFVGDEKSVVVKKLGKKIDFYDTPLPVQQAIANRLLSE